jgi:pimeloyl-ACP methyl ester carboxylesterase
VDDIVREVEGRDLRDVVLVGHSLAGLSIPHAAARLGPRMRRLVFLAAAIPPVGGTIMQMMEHPLSPIARGIDAEQMFCNDLDPQTTAWLLDRLGDEPPGPMAEPVKAVTLPAELPTSYVLLERDETLPPELQLEQAKHAGVDEVIRFDSGHSAFAAKPRELVELLLGWA